MNKILCISLLLYGCSYSKKSKELPNINPQDTVIVFDFHGVVAKINHKQAIKGFVNNKHKIAFLKKLLKQKENCSREAAFLDKDGNISEEDIITLNPYIIDEDVIDIIKDLKSKGYLIFLCSNIGQKMFEFYKNQYPDLFGQNGVFCDCWVSSKDNGYISKDDPKAFKSCKKMISNWCAKNNKKNIKNFIMVDDSKSKLKIAAKEGFAGYKFKNLKKLKCALVKSGKK